MSPHLDDAVLSAFSMLQFVPNVNVVTVFTQAPEEMVTDWDRDRGFPDATAHMTARLHEESLVMRHLGVRHQELGFCPSEYRDSVLDTAQSHAVISAVRNLVNDATAVALPVGAGGAFNLARKAWHRLAPGRRPPGGTTPHPDHLAITDLLLGPLRADGLDIWLYEDLPYLWAGPGDRRAAALSATHHASVTIEVVPVDRQAKADAINRYTSQASAVVLRSPSEVAGVLPTHERFWRFSPQQ